MIILLGLRQKSNLPKGLPHTQRAALLVSEEMSILGKCNFSHRALEYVLGLMISHVLLGHRLVQNSSFNPMAGRLT